ncbi:MAG: hypothetical protein KC800_31095 [Candidatus Eremiobacteraeota bacterium]|nr:hypothetical protein [Candidatus Eremiobacteraeota bacterium]
MGVLRIEEIEPFQSYRFHLGDLEEDASLLSFEQSKLTDTLAGLLDSPWQEPSRSALDELASILIPRRIKDELVLRNEELTLHCDESRIPWESLLGRISLLTEMIAVRPGRTMPRKPDKIGPKGAVHIAESRLMPWATDEKKICLDTWPFSTASSSAQSLFRDATYGCLYLVAFVGPDGEVRVSPGVDLSSVLKGVVRQKRRTCRFCFFHAIQFSDGTQESALTAPLKAAATLLEVGVETVLVSCWEPAREPYLKGLRTFWETLEHGTIGEAFKSLRNTISTSDTQDGSDAFLLLGNPDLSLADLVPVEIPSPMSVTTAPNLGKPDYRLCLTEGPETGRQIPIYSRSLANGKPLVIGRPGIKRCDLEIDDPSAPNQVAQLEFHENSLHVRNLTQDPEAVRLNGLAVGKMARVEGWEQISFGTTTLEIRNGAGERISRPAYASSRGRFALKILSGVPEDAELLFPLTESLSLVGRQGALKLHDQSVSRQHFAVLERDGQHLFSPLGEALVILNGVEAHEETELSPGDQLQLSDKTVLEYIDMNETASC